MIIAAYQGIEGAYSEVLLRSHFGARGTTIELIGCPTFRDIAVTLLYRPAYRKSTRIYDILTRWREPIIEKIMQEVNKSANALQFPNYLKMDRELMKWHITLNYQIIAATVRNRERSIIPAFAKEVARRRYAEGFSVKEVKALMALTGKTMEAFLLKRPELRDSKQRVDDYIVLTSQFAADEFEDAYEMLESQPKVQVDSIKPMKLLTSFENIKLIVAQLEDIGATLFSSRPKGEVVFKKYGALIKIDASKE